MTLELQQLNRPEFVVAPDKEQPRPTYFNPLPNTGFDIALQIGMLPEEPTPQVLFDWLEQTKEDILAFWQEYLKRLPIIPIKVEVNQEKEQIVAACYGGKSLIEITSSEERDGSIKQSVVRIVDFIIKAPSNSVAILTSPPGWSGLKNEDGSPKIYADSQTFIYYKDAHGKIQAFTLISNLSLEDNLNLIYNLGGQEINDNLSTREKIIAITSNPLLLTPGGTFSFDLEGVLRTIHALNPQAFDFERVINLVKNLDELEQITTGSYVREQIANFEKWVIDTFNQYPPQTLHGQIASLLESTVLEISREARIREEQQRGSEETYKPFYCNPRELRSPEVDYQKELHYLQSIPGCNGGGNKANSIFKETTLRLRKIIEGKPGPETYCNTCRSKVATTIKNGIIYCNDCGKEIGRAEQE